ncbi:MAG: hypothetical protein ACLS7Q_07725 [Varibaculum cambriense]
MHPKPAGIIDSRGRKILPGRDGQLKAPVKWVQVAGRKIAVKKTEGPWPINGQWWRPGAPNHLGPRISCESTASKKPYCWCTANPPGG